MNNPFDKREFNRQTLSNNPVKPKERSKESQTPKGTKFQRKKDFHIVETNTPLEVTKKAYVAVTNKLYALYKKLDAMNRKPFLRHTISDTQKAYETAQKLADFLKVAVTKLEAYTKENK